ncbi:MAG TPA: hypothetical protein VFY95_07980 [Sphingomicrobium sp.]
MDHIDERFGGSIGDLRALRKPGPETSGRRSRALRAASVGAQAVGALALGAIAIGALALAALAIGRLAIGRARIGRLEIDDLVVRRLRVTEGLQVPSDAGPGDQAAHDRDLPEQASEKRHVATART